jgi:hypothetical protein
MRRRTSRTRYGFGKKAAASARAAKLAGSQDDMNTRVVLRNPTGETDSIHRGGRGSYKIDVAEEKIDNRSPVKTSIASTVLPAWTTS